jgi:hypothetical protein
MIIFETKTDISRIKQKVLKKLVEAKVVKVVGTDTYQVTNKNFKRHTKIINAARD